VAEAVEVDSSTSAVYEALKRRLFQIFACDDILRAPISLALKTKERRSSRFLCAIFRENLRDARRQRELLLFAR